jgi:Rieske Fe-S protein
MSSDVRDRRSILWIFVSAGAALLASALGALAAVVITPRVTASTRRWRRAASMFDLPPSEPMAAVLTERHADGWYETNQETVVFIDREGDGYRALLATCRHLGCRVKWNQHAQQFQCPCHGGIYDRQGRVVAGPPPQPLERLPVRVNTQTADIEVQW